MQLGHQLSQPGFGFTTLVVVAADLGATICSWPFCHCASSRLPSGSPAEFHFSGPTMVFTVCECSQVASAVWSRCPTALTAAVRTWPAV